MRVLSLQGESPRFESALGYMKGKDMEIKLYKGKPLEEYTKEELIKIINHMCVYYEGRLGDLHKGLELRYFNKSLMVGRSVVGRMALTHDTEVQSLPGQPKNNGG